MPGQQRDGLHLPGTANGAHVPCVLQPAGCAIWAGSRAALPWASVILRLPAEPAALAPCAWWRYRRLSPRERAGGTAQGMASHPSQRGSPRHSYCLQCRGCWLWGLVTQRPSWEKARGDAGVWRGALPGILSGHQPPGCRATSLPSLLAFQVLAMDQMLALVTAREVPRPRAEEGLLTTGAGWAGFLGSGFAASSWSKRWSCTA